MHDEDLPGAGLVGRRRIRIMATMPANLTPEYEKAEQRYREAASDEEKLLALQEMLAKIPKHKGTDKMQADLKRRISQMRKAAAKKGPSRGVDPFHVPKSGAGQVVLVGAPNAGKSSVVAVTTNAPVKVGEYPYTTALPTPGMWAYEDVQIQLVDTPPMTAEHVPAGLMGTIRSGDLVAIVVDAAGDALAEADGLLAFFAGRGLELCSRPRDELDSAGANRRPAVIIATKIDQAEAETVGVLAELYDGRLEVLGVSAATCAGLEDLGRRLWELLAVIRVYTKQPGRPADMKQPYTLPAGATIEDLAREIHRDLPEMMKFARLWGHGRFKGQRVHRTERLRDKDVVEIHQ